MIIRIILLIGFQALLMTHVSATETDSLRLFYGLSGADEKDNKSAQPEVARTESTMQSNAGKRSPVLQRQPSNRKSYHYNGFISSLIGHHYFVNGELLTGLDSIELISTENAGRTLRLKAENGHVFNISIGETKFSAPSREKVRLTDSPVKDAS